MALSGVILQGKHFCHVRENLRFSKEMTGEGVWVLISLRAWTKVLLYGGGIFLCAALELFLYCFRG